MFLSLVVAAAAGYSTMSPAEALTPADVRADLFRVEQAGYSPSVGNDATYPADIQAAEMKTAAEARQQSAKANGDFGGMPMGTSVAGTRVDPKRTRQLECAGAPSICNVYFGS